MPSKIGNKLAPELFSTDPAVQRAFLNRLKDLSASEKERMLKSMQRLSGVTGLAGTQSGLLIGDR
jgi:hypothetical protein